jgi:uncharacterized membrane protein
MIAHRLLLCLWFDSHKGSFQHIVNVNWDKLQTISNSVISTITTTTATTNATSTTGGGGIGGGSIQAILGNNSTAGKPWYPINR